MSKMDAEKIILRVKSLGFPELEGLSALTELSGRYLNNLAQLPNGEAMRILDDEKDYLAAQVEPVNSTKCWGIAADERQIAIFIYEENGSNCELLAWIKY